MFLVFFLAFFGHFLLFYSLEISFFKLAHFRIGSYLKKPNQNFTCLKIPGPDMKEGKHGGRPLCSYLEPQNTKGSVTSDVELDGAGLIGIVYILFY